MTSGNRTLTRLRLAGAGESLTTYYWLYPEAIQDRAFRKGFGVGVQAEAWGALLITPRDQPTRWVYLFWEGK